MVPFAPIGILATVLAIPPTWPPEATERPDPPSPREQLDTYRQKERARYRGTVAGLSLFGTGASLVVFPWAVFAVRNSSIKDEGYAELGVSAAGGSIAILGGFIALGSGLALRALRRQGPPTGLASRMRIDAGGLTLRF